MAQAQTALPVLIQKRINQAKSGCDHAVMESGFLTKKDINGDGVKDYILDYEKFECSDGSSGYCGSAGCVTQVYVSLPNGNYVKVLDENVYGISFVKIKQRPAMILELHSSACGKAGAAPCRLKLFWNGQKFSPAIRFARRYKLAL
jgi:hypothetical protein